MNRPATRHPHHSLSDDSMGGASLPADLVGTVVPEQILQEDEIVILLLKPSILYIFYTAVPFMLGALLLGILLVQMAVWSPNVFFTAGTISLLTVLACVGRLIWSLLVWTSHTYMLTNRRIVTIKGVLSVHMFQANLRKIQKTDLYRPLALRILGTGTIAFSTAASGGMIDSTWVMIARPLETHDQIAAAINKAQSR
jgi:uncharacterized membrane protein YdbT with pleckstrin-like domain